MKTATAERPDLWTWMTPAEAMAYLGLKSSSALYRAIANGLPYGRVGGRYRFRRHDLDQWVQVRTHGN